MGQYRRNMNPLDYLKKTASKLNFGAKSAKRHTVDYSYRKVKKPNPDNSVTISMKDYISTDPDLAAAMRKFVDNVLIQMPEIIKTHKSTLSDSTIEMYNQQLRDVRFYRKFRNGIYSLLFSGNAFFEIKFSGRKLKELYNIDPDTIEIKTNDAGEPVQYVQKVNDAPEVVFAPEEIIHITIDHLETSEWGMAFLKPLKSAMFRKQVAEDYLQWLIANNKFSPIVKARTLDSMQVDEMARIRADIESREEDPNRIPFINFGKDEDIELMYLYNTESFDIILAYIQKQKEAIITLLQVPPIIAGTVDNSNRSNSEIQARYVFYNTILAFQNMLVEELNYDMLRKLNWKQCTFEIGQHDKQNDVDLLKIAKSMRHDLGFTQEAVEEYLRQNGFKLPKVAELFDQKFSESLFQSKQPQDSNNNEVPSRQPRDKRGIPQNEKKRIEDKQMGVSSNAN